MILHELQQMLVARILTRIGTPDLLETSVSSLMRGINDTKKGQTREMLSLQRAKAVGASFKTCRRCVITFEDCGLPTSSLYKCVTRENH